MGFVKDIKNMLSNCDIAIVPLKRGEGTKLKIFDYVQVGLPIITTKKGIEGFEFITENKDILIVNEIDEFIKKIDFLIENPKIRRKFENNIKKHVNEVLKVSKMNFVNKINKVAGDALLKSQ